jgi:ABC-type multidrug transport system fused ATPase/permease subunit
VILATHQAHLVSQADKVLILDSGRQVFFGKYSELEEKGLLSYLGTMSQTKKDENAVEVTEKKIERQATIRDRKSIMAEESAQGNVPIKIYWRFFMLGFKHPIFLVFALIFQVVGQVSYLSIIFWVAYWSRSSNQESSSFIYIMGILVFILYLLTFTRVFVLTFPLLNSCKRVHNLALTGLSFTNSLYFDRNPTGRMLNRFAKDTSQIDEIMIVYIIESVFSFCFVIGNFVTVVIILPYIVIVLFAVIIYFVSVARYFNIVNKSLKRLEQVTKSPVISLFNSSINGLITIRCQNLQKKLKGDLKEAIEINYKTYCAFHLLFRTIQMYLEFGPNILGVINIIVLVYLKDSSQPGLAGMSITLTTSLVGFVGYLFKTIIETDNFMTSTQRLIEYQDLPSEGELEITKDFKITQGKIEVKNLFMRYRSNYDFALKDLTFTIQPGMKTGIVGRTGAGKSSIMQVLFRLTNPEEGTIFIDGQDYLEAGLHDLRKQMSVIPQSATLFIASLRDNLDPFHEHSDKEIIRVLKKTRLGTLFDNLPKGLDSEINSSGLGLSAGQKQLVCLARAILRKNKIIMIDEATANVDSETDQFIQSQLDKRFKGCTLIIIAHRLRTVADSDWIIVMDAGRTVEEGPPRDLVKRKKSNFLKMIKHTGPEESEYLLSRLNY